jgi:ABC-type maltose transport system permease subunit
MTIGALPVLAAFLALQKWFIRGLTAGALKG